MKMSKLKILLLFLCPFVALQAEVVVNQKGKCGYADESGNLIVDYKYDFIGPFSEHNVAVVKKGKKFGMVNSEGEEVLPAVYDALLPHTEGSLLLMQKNKFGLASADGTLLHKAEYEQIFRFNKQGIALALVKQKDKNKLFASNNVFALLKNDGQELTRTTAEKIQQLVGESDKQSLSYFKADTINTSSGYFYDGSTYTLYDIDGEVAMNFEIRNQLYDEIFGGHMCFYNHSYDLREIENNPSCDVMSLRYNQKVDDTHLLLGVGYYNVKEKRLIYHRTFLTHKVHDKKNNTYRYAGDSIFVDLFSFKDGYGLARVDATTKYFARKGDYIIDKYGYIAGIYKYKSSYQYHNGYMVVFDWNGKAGLVDTKGNLVVDYKYTTVKTSVSNTGLWAVKNDSLWGVLSVNGDTLAPFEYDKVTMMAEGDVYFVRKGRWHWGAYRRDSLILPCEYDSIYSFIRKTFLFRRWGSCGVYSTTNDHRTWTLYNYRGTMKSYNAHPEYHNGQIRLLYEESDDTKKYGLVNGFAEEVVPFIFEDENQAYKAYLYYRDKPLQKFGYFDTERLKLFFSRRSRTYTPYSIVPDSDWDY